MRAYARAEGWVCRERRSREEEGRGEEPMRRQLPALYNSVPQKPRCASQLSAAGRVSVDYRPVRPNHFCFALCWREDSNSGHFPHRGGSYLPWAPGRHMRRRFLVFWPIFQDLWVATRTPRTPLLSPSRRWRIWAITADRRPTASTNIIRASRTDSPWTLTIISLIWTEWEPPEHTPPNLNTTLTATDSSDITTEITCRLHPPARVSAKITGNVYCTCVYVGVVNSRFNLSCAMLSILFLSFLHDFFWLFLNFALVFFMLK